MNMHAWQVWCWNAVREESWRKAANLPKNAKGVVRTIVHFVFVSKKHVFAPLTKTSLLMP